MVNEEALNPIPNLSIPNILDLAVKDCLNLKQQSWTSQPSLKLIPSQYTHPTSHAHPCSALATHLGRTSTPNNMAVTTNLSVLPPHLNLGFFGSVLSKRSQERGYKFYINGYIHGVKFSAASSEELSIKASCYRSMRKHEKPHTLNAIVDIPQRCFKLTHCSCTAG
jgi:hypothetical protein